MILLFSFTDTEIMPKKCTNSSNTTNWYAIYRWMLSSMLANAILSNKYLKKNIYRKTCSKELFFSSRKINKAYPSTTSRNNFESSINCLLATSVGL